eukprot:SAG11_NODE_5443_length_1558_cov_1.884167_3_plen_130_part_00
MDAVEERFVSRLEEILEPPLYFACRPGLPSICGLHDLRAPLQAEVQVEAHGSIAAAERRLGSKLDGLEKRMAKEKQSAQTALQREAERNDAALRSMQDALAALAARFAHHGAWPQCTATTFCRCTLPPS